MALKLEAAAWDAVRAHVAEAYPQECCGVLVGPVPHDFAAAGRSVLAEEARRVPNSWESAERRRRYEAEPKTLARLELELAGTRRGVVGFYHSHPDAPARPSAFDLERAWPCYSYLIVAAVRGKVQGQAARVDEARSWVRSPDGASFDEEPIVTG